MCVCLVGTGVCVSVCVCARMRVCVHACVCVHVVGTGVCVVGTGVRVCAACMQGEVSLFTTQLWPQPHSFFMCRAKHCPSEG